MREILIRQLGQRDYLNVLDAMRAFTASRDEHTADELWSVEHPAVFTQGLNGKPEHLLDPGDIPVIQTDRGGQITYHGLGQVVIYCLIDVRRAALGVRELVTRLEQSVIQLLADYGVSSYAEAHAPGVYVNGSKVASLGLRIKRGCTYHGLSLNVAMDLEPFTRINPCGFPGLTVTQLRDLGVHDDLVSVSTALLGKLAAQLGYNRLQITQSNFDLYQEIAHV